LGHRDHSVLNLSDAVLDAVQRGLETNSLTVAVVEPDDDRV
jgi:hypothetical protein